MRETRFWRVPPAEIRAANTNTPVLTGYGSVFMRYSQNLGGFVEQIAHGAFDDVLARTGTNIQGLVNHDPNWLLATTDSGTMTLAAELVGLAYEMQLDPGDPDAVRAMSKVSTGKMRGSSFSFSLPPGGDEWTLTEQGFPLRTIRTFSGLYDVGPVGTPAYLDTEGEGMATALRSLAESRNLNLGAVIDAANRNELRALLEGEQPPPPPEPNADTGPATQHVRTDIDHNRTRLRFGLPIS